MNNNESIRLLDVFFAHARDRIKVARSSKQKFAYYTSAETALKIIQNGELWMRNATVMNDYSEIRYGKSCLVESLNDGGRKALHEVLEPIFPGLLNQVLTELDQQSVLHHYQTYLVCFSEHRPEEDFHGRLSMWRAYGGTSGVALVFDGTALLTESDALKIYSTPVAYFDRKRMLQELISLAHRITNERDLISRHLDTVKNQLLSMLRFAMLSTKHPGFLEELEWRVIYQPWAQQSPYVSHSVEAIRGIPQIVQKIPLKDVPEENFIGADIQTGLDRIIIGPNQFPDSLLSAFSEAMARKGVPNPHKKIHISDIPLRISG